MRRTDRSSDAVARALAEDLLADGDLTAALVPERATAHFALRARQAGVLAGRACATETFRQLEPALPLIWYLGDGSVLVPGQTVMEVTGPLRPILTAERTALNFLGRLSGIATLTARYVAAAHARNPAVEVLDTAQDHAGTARPREGGGPGRRGGQPPFQPLRGRAGQGQPPGRRHHHRGGRPGPGDVAGPRGADRVRHAGAGG